MSTARLGRNWADVDEEDDEDDVVVDNTGKAARCFETPVDANGIKTVIEYKERDGKTYKVTKRVKVNTQTKWINSDMTDRKGMAAFGKPKANPADEASHIQRSVEEVPIELCKKAVQMSHAADAEDKFLMEALLNCESIFKQKKVWTDINKEKQTERDGDVKPADAAAPAAAAAAAPAPGAPGKYVPPSIRAGLTGKGDGKGGKGGDQSQEASLRVTNLSEDVREGDLQDLFAQFGALQRVYLAKDPMTHLSRGFAFVTYYSKQHAQKAIDKLNGHGYDNLILSVSFAKPRD